MTDSQTGSTLEENPLKALTWFWNTKPPTLTDEPLISTEELEPLEPHRKITGEFIPEQERYGYLRLRFDSGLRNKVEAVAQTIKDRKRTEPKQPQKHGWAGQFAFEFYLNYFTKYETCDLIVHHDNPESSQHSEPQDFIIKRPRYRTMRIEIKTAPPHKNKITFCKGHGKPYPSDLVVMRAANDSMTVYDVYGYMIGSSLQKLRTYFKYGKVCSTISLNRYNFHYYNYFHKNALGLPYIEKFSD